MSNYNKSYITFPAQMGDEKSAAVVGPHLVELRKLLDKYCVGPYTSAVDEFAPIVRVDGDIAYWQFEGCQKLRWSKKGRYITIDIGVPRSRWEGVPPIELKKYLIQNLKDAIKLMVNRLKKEKADVDEKRLFSDLAKVEDEFLAER
jgi:hypothetical protein